MTQTVFQEMSIQMWFYKEQVMIKVFKKGDQIFHNFEEKEVLEDGTVVWNIPTDLDEFKALAIDTINWQIGDGVKKTVGNTSVNLSAANAKGIVLVAKLLNTLTPSMDGFTEREKESWNKMVTLAESGYSDSELLYNSLAKASEYIAQGTDKITHIAQAKTHDEIIAILNEG